MGSSASSSQENVGSRRQSTKALGNELFGKGGLDVSSKLASFFVRPKYRYDPMPEGSIRIVTIHPGSFRDEVKITLRFEQLIVERPPLYEALSYVWGSSQQQRSIHVGSSSSGYLSATRNLDVALRYLRNVDKPRDFWIDAICIDQENDIEKGTQVSLMGDIYRLAERVIVWLGSEEDNSNRAMELMKSIGSQVDYDWNNMRMVPMSQDVSDPTLADRFSKLPLDEDDLCSIYHILSRPWFERLWVRQEIFMANENSIVMCGTKTVLWRDFRCAWVCVYVKDCKMFEFYSEIIKRNALLYGFLFQTKFTVVDLHRVFGTAKCSDPRDKIYAVLSLLHDPGIKSDILPDYRKSHIQVYEDIVRRYLHQNGNINILAECELHAASCGPSWVPDWSVAQPNPHRSQTFIFASGTLAASWELHSGGLLKVAGVGAGIIRTLQKIGITTHTNFGDCMQVIRKQVLGDCIGESREIDHDLLESYVRIFSADELRDRIEPPLTDANILSLQESKSILKGLISFAEPKSSSDLSNGEALFISRARRILANRQIFHAEDGRLGVAPLVAMPGDEVSVLLGCATPMLLRPVKKDRYSLVGACYMCHIAFGEALLGSLPDNVRPVRTYVHGIGHAPAFKNDLTGEVTQKDPRIHLQSLYDSSTVEPFIVEPEELRHNMGVRIRHFDLV